MRIAIPHKLSKAEVHQRLDERSGEIANFIPGGVADVESDWVDDDRMALGVTAMGTFVGADIEVEESQVVIEIQLPKKLAFVKGSIERSIRDNATKLLR